MLLRLFFIHVYMLGLSSLGMLSVGGEKVLAQSRPVYYSPHPEIADFGGTQDTYPVLMSQNSGGELYASREFVSRATPDGNLHVYRLFFHMFAEDLGSFGFSAQLNCGEGQYRYGVSRLNNGFTDETSVSSSPSEWIDFSATPDLFSRAMMRTCEIAASDRGLSWTWFSR